MGKQSRFLGEWLGSTVIVVCKGGVYNLEGSIVAVFGAGKRGQEVDLVGRHSEAVRLFDQGCRGKG